MKKKLLYEVPEAEQFVLTFDQVIMGPSDPNAIRPNSASNGYDEDNDLGEI